MRPERRDDETTLEFNARKAHAQRVDLEEMHRMEDADVISEPPLVKATRVWEDVPACRCGHVLTERRLKRVRNRNCLMHRGI